MNWAFLILMAFAAFLVFQCGYFTYDIMSQEKWFKINKNGRIVDATKFDRFKDCIPFILFGLMGIVLFVADMIYLLTHES